MKDGVKYFKERFSKYHAACVFHSSSWLYMSVTEEHYLGTLRAAPYAQVGCNLEMLCLEDSFRINFSNSASLTRVLTVKDCYMGSCQPLSWYERNFK